ncbi:MAG: hypothetical protein M3P39_01185 [Actinomycetota bacterium]|jgi:hypothetical protein|nr:hypothetical protein [Actinomycetota bacterium]
MGLIYVTTMGLVVWLVLWAIGIRAVDAFLVTFGIIMLGVAGRILLPYLPGRQES